MSMPTPSWLRRTRRKFSITEIGLEQMLVLCEATGLTPDVVVDAAIRAVSTEGLLDIHHTDVNDTIVNARVR